MSFIGNVPAEAYSTVAKDTFSGNGSTTDFTLSIPATTNGVEVFVENVQQEPTDAYTISGTTLSFTAAPVSGTDNIYVIHRGPAVQQVVPPAGVAIDASSVTASGNLSVTGTTTLTDDLAVDTNTLVVDTTNNRVGIGTSSPDELLELSLNTGATLKITSTDPALLLDEVVGAIEFETSDSTNSGIAAKIEAIAENASGEVGLSFSTGAGGSAAEAVRIDRDKNLQFNSGYGSVATAYGCRAWVNFDGTGTVAIRDSGNVSSIIDNGVGDYNVQFASSMPDTNYCLQVSGGRNSNTGHTTLFGPASNDTNGIRVISMDSGNTKDDYELMCVAVFR